MLHALKRNIFNLVIWIGTIDHNLEVWYDYSSDSLNLKECRTSFCQFERIRKILKKMSQYRLSSFILQTYVKHRLYTSTLSLAGAEHKYPSACPGKATKGKHTLQLDSDNIFRRWGLMGSEEVKGAEISLEWLPGPYLPKGLRVTIKKCVMMTIRGPERGWIVC